MTLLQKQPLGVKLKEFYDDWNYLKQRLCALKQRIFLGHCTSPVSYTHLDVYKRQALKKSPAVPK